MTGQDFLPLTIGNLRRRLSEGMLSTTVIAFASLVLVPQHLVSIALHSNPALALTQTVQVWAISLVTKVKRD